MLARVFRHERTIGLGMEVDVVTKDALQEGL